MEKRKESVFTTPVLKGSNLFLSSKSNTPFMVGVAKVTVGSKSNRIEMLDGQVYEYTPDWQTLLAFNGQKTAQIRNFRVESDEELEVLSEYDLVKGHGLKVINEHGMVLHKNVRAFMFINDRIYLIREADGGWNVCYAAIGVACREKPLSRTNLSAGRKKMLFDERGKLHLNQWSPLYCDNLYFD